MWLLVWVLACASAPTVDGVQPGPVLTGGQVQVRGSGLSGPARLRLVRGDQVVEIPAEARGADVIAAVPADLPIGRYQVVVVVGDRELAAPEPVVVEEAPELPCTGAFVSTWSLALARQELVLDRFPKDGDPESLRFPLAQVVRVELERTRVGDDRCQAIYVRLTDGRRRLVQDELRGELLGRAERLAGDMRKPLEVAGDVDASAQR